MTLLIGGAETGLQNTTLNLLGRNDQPNTATTDNGDRMFVNVANGNLIYSHQDTYLPSRGQDFRFLRTYNSRAVSNDAFDFSDARWAANTSIGLKTLSVNGTTVYELRYGDGSVYQFKLDPATGLFTSTQGDGAYETLRTTVVSGKITGFVVTRADQSALTFDAKGFLTGWADTNGVSMTFTYKSGRLEKVVDDTGHTFTYKYTSSRLSSIVDETGVTLVSYTYDSGRLASVTDRYGHVTRYYYTSNGYLQRIVLPTQAAGQGNAADATVREIKFEYTLFNWSGTSSVSTPVLTKMTDAMGNVTTFSYAFNLVGNTYNGVRTTVTDALGKVTTYECNASGYITRVIDESLFETSYTYDARGNLTSVTDRNGWGAANSDSPYYRDLRESLGFARNLASLSAADKTSLLAMFTRSFTYDARGNVLTSSDNSGNVTTYTYTSFNRISTVHAPEGGLTQYFYDANQNLVEQVDPGGDITRFTYDIYGNLTSKIVYLARPQEVSAGVATAGTTLTLTLPGHGFAAGQAVAFSTAGTLPAGLVKGKIYYVVGTPTADTFTVGDKPGAGAIASAASTAGSAAFTVTPYQSRSSAATANTGSGTTALTWTANNHGLAEGQGVIFGVSSGGRLPAGLAAGQMYYLRNVTENSFQVALTRDGAVVTLGTALAAAGTFTVTDYRERADTLDRSKVITAAAKGSATAAVAFTLPAHGLSEGQAVIFGVSSGGRLPAGLVPGKTYYVMVVNAGSFRVSATPRGAALTYGASTAGSGTYSLVDYLDRGRVVAFNGKVNATTVLTVTRTAHGLRNGQSVVFSVSAGGTVPAGLIPGRRYFVTNAKTDTFQVAERSGGAALAYGASGTGSGTFSIVDRQVTSYSYDAFGNNISTVDAEGFTTSGLYDPFGNLLEFTDGRGNKYLYSYDKDNRLLSSTDPEGRVTTSTYDAVGNRVSVTTGWNNHTITSVYDKNNRLITTIDPSTDVAKNRKVERSYDVVGNGTSIKDAEGRVTTYTYNARRELVEIKTAAVDDDGNAATAAVIYSGTIAYDGEGNRIAVTDNRNLTTSYRYTRDGLLQLQTTADGQITQFSYDKNQNLLSIVAGMQLELLKRQTTIYAYDAEDQLVNVTDAKGNTTAYAYDAPGNMVEMTDAEGRVSRMHYDLNNRLRLEVSAEVTDPVTGQPTRYTVEHRFDGNGNEIETIDQNGKSTLFVYDKVDRNTRITDANGIVTTFGYDGNDNVTRVEIRGPGATEAASVSTYVYDEFNQLLAETDGVGNALVTSDASAYQTLRMELGYTVNGGGVTRGKLVSELTQSEKTTLLDAFTTRYTYDRVGNLKTQVDHLGRTTSLEFDALDRMVRATDALGGTQQFRYDGNGNLLSETDELGRVTTYTYDPLGRVATRSDPLGSGTETTLTAFVYDSFGNLLSRTEASGAAAARTTRFEYDLNNLLTAMIEPGERKTSYAYDRVGNRIRVTDARVHTTEFTYDALDRVIKVRDPLSNEVRFEYDGVGNRIAMVDARGTRTRMVFDPGNRMTEMIDGEGRKTVFSYDALGNTITMTTGAGTSGAGSLGAETTRYEYDAESNLRAVVDADDTRTTFGFDRVYNETSVTDARGHTTTTAFDALNRAVLVTDAEGGTTRYAYDATGNVLSVEDANGNFTRYAYDRANRVITETDALGVQTTYTYDAFGASTTITRAANRPAGEQRVMRMEYDEVGNLYKEIDQNENFKQYTYDKNDNVTRITDENGHHTDYSYDEDNRVTAVTDHLGGVTRFSHDGNGNRTVVEDAVGNKTTYYYNANDELALKVDALGYATAYTYDANGNLVGQTLYATAVPVPVGPETKPVVVTDAERDQTSRITYDKMNRVISIEDGEEGVTHSVYDAVGNLTEYRDPNGNLTRYTYDGNDRVTTIMDAEDGETSFTYDALGRLLSRTDANQKPTHYVYDALGRLTRETDPEGGHATYEYDAVGNLVRQEDQNGNETLYAYDALDRTVRMTDARGFYIEFAYDAVGNRTSVKDQRGNTTTYVFDALNRQVRVINPELDYMAYGYDAVGRLIGMDQNGDQTLFTLDALGRVAKRTDALGGEALISYDHAGNEISRQDESGVLTSYEYDRNNRLIATVDDSGKRAEFGYDLAGNLVSGRDERGNITHFGYDRLNRQVSETDPLGNRSTSTFDGVGNLVSFEDMNGGVFHARYDGNNRRVALLSKEGYLTEFDYDAVGNEIERREYNDRYALVEGNMPAPKAGDTPRVTTLRYNELNQLESQTDPAGLTLRFEYDEAGNRIRTVQLGGGSPAAAPSDAGAASFAASAEEEVVLETVEYDGNNRIIQRTDAQGAVTTVKVDDLGNILERTEGVGTPGARTTTYTYDERGRTLTETNALGRVISYTYDASDRMLSRTTDGADVDPRVETFDYDLNGRLESQVDGVGTRTRYEYDAAGNTTRVTYAANTTDEYSVRYEYDANNRLTAEIDGKGVRTEFVHDARGNKVETIQAKGIPGEERSTVYAYDAQDRLISITNPENETTTYYYDALGNQACIVDAKGGITFNTFDPDGRILTNTIGAGTVVELAPGAAAPADANVVTQGDKSFVVTLTSEFGGVKTTNTYDARGNVLSTSIGYANGTDVRTTTYEYDGEDRMTALTDGEGFTNRFEYDVFGNQKSITIGLYEGEDAEKRARAHPQTTLFFYDKADQLIKAIDGEGNVITNAYDRHGNKISMTTGARNTDATLGPVSSDAAHLSTTTYGYDLAGRLIRTETAEGGVLLVERDALGREKTISRLQSGSEDTGVWSIVRYERDCFGRTTRETDANGIVTTTEYDAVGNTTGITRAAGTGMARTTIYGYDLMSRLVSQQDPLGGVTQWAYDDVGNVISITDAEGNVERSYYDGYNRLSGTVSATGLLTTFERDSAGNEIRTVQYAVRVGLPAGNVLPTVAADAGDRLFLQAFNGNNKRVTETYADGAVNRFEFDSCGLLIRQTNSAATDQAALARTADTADRVMRWDWDDAGRLVGFTNVDGVTESYTYDAANNRTSATIHDPNLLATGGLDADRITTYEYDDNNRLIAQSIGANRQELGYDKIGNVISKQDGRGNISRTAYDEGNRVVSISDPKGGELVYGYDAAGRLSSLTDARGNVRSFLYDGNDRLIEERAPAATTFTIDGGFADGVGISHRDYDKVGNLVSSTDAAGFRTQWWYDASNRIVAEVSGDDVLRTYEYNAFGQVAAVSTAKERVANRAALQAGSVPAASGPVVTIRTGYDTRGRAIRTVLPEVGVSTLVGAGAGTSASEAVQALEERSLYDAWGNLVESVDRAGNSSFAWYDTRGRLIALVDAEGFLVETRFDSQDHVVRQTKYTAALSGASAGSLPVAPGTGEAYSIDRYYDVEGNLVREVSPEVSTVDGLVRVETVFLYDAAGNLVSRTVANGTAQAQTEHYYYDASNLRVAVVTAGRTLATFRHDENGNTIEQRRYATPVADTVNLDTVTASQLVSGTATPPANVNDQVRSFEYDARNLQTRKTEHMGAGTADDIVVQSWYDANGNNTRKIDGDGFTGQIAYDAAGRITRTITPDGAWSYVEYNTFGLKTRAWIGGDPDSRAPAALDIDATLANGSAAAIDVAWGFPENTETNGLTAWVAWDTTSHASLGADDIPSDGPNAAGVYANASAASRSIRSVGIPLSDLTAGQTVYFRVMVQDSFGNLSWSAEQSVVVPPALQDVTVRQIDAGAFEIEVEFSASVDNPRLLVAGVPQAMVPVAGSRYRLSLAGLSDPASLQIGFAWTSGGRTYESSTTDLLQAASAPRETGVPGWVESQLPRQGATPVGSTQLVVLDGVLKPASESIRSSETLQFKLPPLVPPATSRNYDIYHGDAVSEAHTLDISFTDTQNRTATFTGYNRDGNNVIVSTNYALQWVSNNDNKVQTTIALGLDSAETARISGDLKLSWRARGSDGNFSSTELMAKSGNVFSRTLDLDENTVYDIKLWYTDTNGKEVIVAWRRFTTAAESVSSPAGTTTTEGADNAPPSATQTVAVGTALQETDQHSMTVLASERGGLISGTTGSLVFTTGLYSGPVDAAVFSAALEPVTAGTAGEFQAGRLKGDECQFFTQIEYDDLGRKIASNENDGLWREYGLDASGNVVVTRLLGDDRLATVSIDSFARFDARNLEVETIGPVAGGQAAITRTAYDYAGRIVSVQDPGNGADQKRLYAYDSAGAVVRETDALGNVTQHRYDRLGNLVRTEDPLGNRQIFEYTYTGANANRLTRSYFAGLASTTNVTYGYDAFGRRTSMTKGVSGQTTTATITVSYDQRDQRVSVTDAENHTTSYEYDKRGHQTWVRDANGNVFRNAYDAMGRLSHQYSFSVKPASLDQAKGWLSSGMHLVTQETVYNVFGNRIATIDPMGRRNSLSYGAFGRLLTAGDTSFGYDTYGRRTGETGGGRNITRSYDAAGRLTEVNDRATVTRTVYTYDAAGNRQAEILTVSGVLKRSQTYEYNARQELTRWTDTAPTTAITQSYDYWEDGNLKSVTNGSGTRNYTFDAADRITQAGDVTFSYDYAGNRASEGSVTYDYDKNGWLKTATPSGGTTSTWTYDAVGNVLTRSDGSATETNTYDTAYRITTTVKGSDTTVTTFDKSGRTLSTRVSGENSEGEPYEYIYSYNYNDAGQQTSATVSGTGSAYGTSTSEYDANGRLVRVDRGDGDGDGTQVSTFAYDSDGNIVERSEDGVLTYYLYAMGDPVGEYTNAATPTLNTGNYAALKTIATGLEDGKGAFPDSSIIQHTVAPGDTLQSIAGQYYGSPDLWFVIAEANGLTGGAPLEVGSRLVVPSTAQNAYHTAATHALYKEGDIVGSKLPNVTTPPPEEDKCAKIGAIILIVLVAIVAIVLTVVTVGVAAPAAALVLTGTSAGLAFVATSVAIGAVIGAAIAFAASVATQAILVEMLNQEWDWNAVLADTLVGFVGGAAAGLGAAVAAAGNITKMAKIANVVGQAALESAGETASQAIQNNGQIVSPWLVLASAAGGALGGVGDVWKRSSQLAKVTAGAVEASEATADLAKISNRVTDTSLSLIEDVAETARRAGKTRLGVFSDVARFQFAEMTGSRFGNFTQTIAKGGGGGALANLDEGKKIVRTFTKITDSASAVAEYKQVDRLSSVGKGITSSLTEWGESARRSLKQAQVDFSDWRRSEKGVSSTTGFYGPGSRVDYIYKTDPVTGVGMGRYVTVEVDDRGLGARLSSAVTEGFDEFIESAGTAITSFVDAASKGVSRAREAAVASFKQGFESAGKSLRKGIDDLDDWINTSKTTVNKFEAGIEFRRYTDQAAAGTELDPNVRDLRGMDMIGGTEAARTRGMKVVRTTVRGQVSYAEVARDSIARTGKWERFRDPILGSTRPITELAEGKLKKIGASVVDGLKGKLDEAAQGISTDDGKKFWAYAVQDFLVMPGEIALRNYEENRSDTTSVSTSLYSLRGALRKGGKNISKINQLSLFMPAFFPAFSAYQSSQSGEGWSLSANEISRTFTLTSQQRRLDSQADEARGSTPYTDSDALRTYADLHARQRNYLALEWRSVAASTSTAMLSPFSRDRAAGVNAQTQSSRMVSGAVSSFDSASVVAFAEASVGGVGGDPSKTPGWFG